ncbi:unnamed protein product [Arctia plantaginis]|uniref:PHD-type domain-containing protein n=1 Tax=Arctia plantaginis TaxID=874455 RepID=A0A8S1AYJ2_ARCPL|nr:unnamed protein product [Arctia plantaginis]
MVKCLKCNKVINKKTPGLQCVKCMKWIHGTCANLSPDQLSVLFDTESADWKCRSCTGNTKPKRLSFIMPDQEEEENTDSENISASCITQKMISEIRHEIRDIIQSELQSVLQFYSDKIDEYEIKMKNYENQIGEYKNMCKNLNLKSEVLEQKINTIEQNFLSNHLEIHGIQEQTDENIMSITKSICVKLSQKSESVVKAYRKKVNKRGTDTTKPSPIVVVLANGDENRWITASKSNDINTKDIGMKYDSKIYIRESLTPNNSFLLWKAKTTVKHSGLCKFVWYKRGLILAKRTEKEKSYVIRAIEDIERLVAEFSNNNNAK